jgi:NADH dehydrogenase
MPSNIVIAGGGFAGAGVARYLEERLPSQAARVSLVNDTNHLLYTPLLPEAAAGMLEPRHVVTPLRDILHRTYIRPGAITGHDPVNKTVMFSSHDGEDETLPYDQLIVAVGSVSRVLPIPGLAKYALGFKNLADAIWLRNRIIQMLETANATEDPARREQLLTFVVVGGGYSGLEALAEAQDYAASAIKSYPAARLHGMRWVLIEHQQHLLHEISPALGDWAVSELRGRGIEFHLGSALASVDETGATLKDGTVIPAKTVVWTAGVKAHPSLANLAVPLDKTGRVITDKTMAVQGLSGVWALGDCAAVPDPRHKNKPCPPTAQHAIREAKVCGANVLSYMAGKPIVPFTYKSKGAFVNLGRYKAVAKVGPFKLSGKLAWWITRTYHLSQIPGRSRKIRAIIDWTVSIPFPADTAEVGTIGTPRPLTDEQYKYGGSHRPVKPGHTS